MLAISLIRLFPLHPFPRRVYTRVGRNPSRKPARGIRGRGTGYRPVSRVIERGARARGETLTSAQMGRRGWGSLPPSRRHHRVSEGARVNDPHHRAPSGIYHCSAAVRSLHMHFYAKDLTKCKLFSFFNHDFNETVICHFVKKLKKSSASEDGPSSDYKA